MYVLSECVNNTKLPSVLFAELKDPSVTKSEDPEQTERKGKDRKVRYVILTFLK